MPARSGNESRPAGCRPRSRLLGKLFELPLVLLDRLHYRAVVLQVLPEQDLVTRYVHLVGRTVQLATEFGKRDLRRLFTFGSRLDSLLDLQVVDISQCGVRSSRIR